VGQKVNPLGFRLGITKKAHSDWFASRNSYASLLEQDYKVRSYVDKKLSNRGISRVEIKRDSGQVDINFYTSRPGMLVGRSGESIEAIRSDLLLILGNSIQLHLNVFDVPKVDADAKLVADFIVQQLQKRVAFRRVLRTAIQKIQSSPSIKGVKLQIAGRLNGAEIARTEWVREGRVPLQTLRANIDYCSCQAHTIYGVLGIKVWIFLGEEVVC
jgi:small subunit ribosomal protein S3